MTCFLVGFGGCSTEKKADESSQSVIDEPAARASIMALLNRQQNDWNEGDIEGFMEGYLVSDSLRFASDNSILYGWQTTIDRYHRTYSSRELMGVLEFDIVDVRVTGPRHAIVFGKFHLSRSEDVGDAEGLFTLLLMNTADGWKIVADHTST